MLSLKSHCRHLHDLKCFHYAPWSDVCDLLFHHGKGHCANSQTLLNTVFAILAALVLSYLQISCTGDLWLVQICWMSYSSMWSPLTWPMVMFILFIMCVRACVSHAYARAHTHTLVVCEHVLEYCFICIALADLYYTNNMMAYIYPCSTSIFTHKMLVDGLSQLIHNAMSSKVVEGSKLVDSLGDLTSPFCQWHQSSSVVTTLSNWKTLNYCFVVLKHHRVSRRT